MSHDYLFKYVVVGDSGVGKTNLALQFTEKTFRLSHITTVGVEFGIRRIIIDNKLVKLHIWDTTGQETFRCITRSYYRDVTVAMIVYDITDRRSFDHLESWLKELREYTSPDVAITLIGNKNDLEDERKVARREGEVFARKHDLVFMETSAKTASNVEKAFLDAADEIYGKIKRGEFTADSKTGVITLDSNDPSQSSSESPRQSPSSNQQGGKCGGC